MKVLSLFSGVGGFDMGLENAGMETVFQCEWDKHANTILHKHWPDVPKWEDVSTLTGKHILANAPIVDVVAWGSPCQDLSVAGKRAGLEGGRSGLFHEGIRIIKELQEETNGQYPRISIWENVVGALNSNRGADFGVILDEMAEAGALAIEWAVLDAQYFGVPQRRRRVFVIAIFDPVLANRSPNPLLPVAESLPGHLAKGKPQRKSATSSIATSVGTDGQWAAGTTPDGDILRTSVTSKWHKGSGGPSGSEFYNMVVENQGFTSSSFAGYSEGVGTLRSNGGDLGGGNETLVTEPFVKSSRAQTSDDSETWIPGEVNPTLNSFDVGDTRATTAIIEVDPIGTLQARQHKGANHEGARDGHLIVEEPVPFENSYRDGARIANDGVSQTLTSKMGTGGGNTPMLAFDTQFGSNANVTEDVAPTLKSSQQAPSVAYSIREDAKANTFSATELDHANSLSALRPSPQSHHAQMFIAETYPIDTRNALRDPEKYDAQNRQGLGIGADGDPMATLTSAHVNAVAYDEYNDTTNEVHHALRAGTKQSTGVLLGSEVAATLRSGGDGGVPSSRGEHLVTEPTMAVRRLTPLECERLMGWPDDHTRYKADGTEQADTHRYKQCGNGVASPVAQWIAKHILAI
jgi:DNA (cytosine-5)-methyltransferase 1